MNGKSTHETIRALATERAAHDARSATALLDADIARFGDELRDMDARMTGAARSLLARDHLTDADLAALAQVLRHFSEDDGDGGAVLDEREIVSIVLARLLTELSTRAHAPS